MPPEKLVRLLSGRNEPSVLAKEALFQRILTKLEPAPSRWRCATILAAVTALAGAMAAAVLVLRPPDGTPSAAEFVSRGTEKVPGPWVRLACLRGARETECRLGTTLVFEVHRLPETVRFFAAFARRSDGTVFWYFPGPTGRSPELKQPAGLLEQAVRLGPPHSPGEYEVFALFSRQPMTRVEIKAALGPEPKRSEQLLVTRRRLLLRDAR
ncbi:hypothetical protein ACFL5O_06710 [Myxococcota bacterium]